MKNIALCWAVLTLFAGTCWGAQKKGQEQPSGDSAQRFVVMHSDHFIASTETLTNAEANCSIVTAAGAASMQCRPTGITAKNLFHYNSALIVDPKGTGYIIACRVTLIEHWCKEYASGTVIVGSMDQTKLSIPDGDKVRVYAMLTSAFVGVPATPPPTQAAAPPKAAVAASSPAPAPRASAAAAPPASVAKATDNSERASGETAACTSAAGACVSFVSDPLGADIYVDGKFAGNTPSALNLAPGSHEIRVESANRKLWTRTLEVSAGSKITIRATLEAAPEK